VLCRCRCEHGRSPISTPRPFSPTTMMLEAAMRRMLSLPYTASCLECKSSSIAISPCAAAPFEAIFAFFLGGVLSSESATINIIHAINILSIGAKATPGYRRGNIVQLQDALPLTRSRHRSIGCARPSMSCTAEVSHTVLSCLSTRRNFACQCRQFSAKTGRSDA